MKHSDGVAETDSVLWKMTYDTFPDYIITDKES